MTTATAGLKDSPVAKGSKKQDDMQVTFRLAADLHARVKAAAEGMSLDISSLLRLLIRENLPVYEERAEEIRRREQKEGEPDA